MNWEEVAKAIGQTAVIVSAGAWILKALVKHFLTLDVEHYKRDLQVSSTRELEQFKSELALAAHERTTTFLQLHTRRSEVIAKLYELLVAAEESVENFVDPRRKSTDPQAHAAYQDAFDRLKDLNLYFRRNRIYLGRALCGEIEQLFDKLHGPAWDTSYFYALPAEHRDASVEERQERIRLWTAFKTDVPPIMQRVEEEFRRVLGVITTSGEGTAAQTAQVPVLSGAAQLDPKGVLKEELKRLGRS